MTGREFDLRNVGLTELKLQVDQNGESAALKAVKRNDWDIFSLVATSSEAWQARDRRGRNIAMHAALNGSFEKDRLLASPPYFGSAGDATVFMGEMLSFDLSALALQDEDGKTALQHAKDRGHQQVVDILTQHLQAIVRNQSVAIDSEGGPVDRCYQLRGQAWQALGETERAKEDLDRASAGRSNG